MYGYIYLTENLINGMCYIGQHKSDRKNNSYKGSGVILSKAFKHYGKYNFVCTPIQWCNSLEELNNAEEYWINKCNAVKSPMFYNLIPGGGNTFKVRDMSGKNNPMYGSHRVGEYSPLSNKVCINDGKNYFYIDNDKLELALSLGYQRGGVKKVFSRKRSDAAKITIKSKQEKGFTTSGYAWFKHPILLEHKYIKLSNCEEIEMYIKNGYVRGDLTKEEKLKKKEVKNNNGLARKL